MSVSLVQFQREQQNRKLRAERCKHKTVIRSNERKRRSHLLRAIQDILRQGCKFYHKLENFSWVSKLKFVTLPSTGNKRKGYKMLVVKTQDGTKTMTLRVLNEACLVVFGFCFCCVVEVFKVVFFLVEWFFGRCVFLAIFLALKGSLALYHILC